MEYEFSVTFSASSFDEAQDRMDDALSGLCGGEGDGEDHVCEFSDWAARGPSLIKEDDNI